MLEWRKMEIPNAENARRGHRLVMENGRRHVTCGNILAKMGEYGPAVSHMVLSAEESIKAIFFQAIGYELEIPPSSIRPFLASHRPRHAAAAMWTLMGLLFDQWIGLIIALNDEFQGATGPEYWRARADKVAALASELNALADARPGENKIMDQLLWWGQSESLKQRGFYVDFRDGDWVSPDSVTKAEFAQAKCIAEELIERAEKAEEVLASISPDERQRLRQVVYNLSVISHAPGSSASSENA